MWKRSKFFFRLVIKHCYLFHYIQSWPSSGSVPFTKTKLNNINKAMLGVQGHLSQVIFNGVCTMHRMLYFLSNSQLHSGTSFNHHFSMILPFLKYSLCLFLQSILEFEKKIKLHKIYYSQTNYMHDYCAKLYQQIPI